MEFGRRGTGQRAQGDRSGLAGRDFVSWDRYVNSSHREPSEVSRQERWCQEGEPRLLCAWPEALAGKQGRALLHS